MGRLHTGRSRAAAARPSCSGRARRATAISQNGGYKNEREVTIHHAVHMTVQHDCAHTAREADNIFLLEFVFYCSAFACYSVFAWCFYTIVSLHTLERPQLMRLWARRRLRSNCTLDRKKNSWSGA